jgi:hypothetical protein
MIAKVKHSSPWNVHLTVIALTVFLFRTCYFTIVLKPKKKLVQNNSMLETLMQNVVTLEKPVSKKEEKCFMVLHFF